MRKDRSKAYELRMQGKSYAQISRHLRIPKATLSAWFSRIPLPPDAAARIRERIQQKNTDLAMRNRERAERAHASAGALREKAAVGWGRLSRDPLFTTGVAIYLAQGHKAPTVRGSSVRTTHAVRITTRSTDIARLFVRWLQRFGDIQNERIRCTVYHAPSQNPAHAVAFWMSHLSLPPQTFTLRQSREAARSRHEPALHGFIQITVASTALWHRIMGWIDAVKAAV